LSCGLKSAFYLEWFASPAVASRRAPTSDVGRHQSNQSKRRASLGTEFRRENSRPLSRPPESDPATAVSSSPEGVLDYASAFNFKLTAPAPAPNLCPFDVPVGKEATRKRTLADSESSCCLAPHSAHRGQTRKQEKGGNALTRDYFAARPGGPLPVLRQRIRVSHHADERTDPHLPTLRPHGPPERQLVPLLLPELPALIQREIKQR
jgi:hypothetical protein